MTVAAVGDDPPALFAAGSFHSINGTVSPGFARWDGVRWDSLGGGLDALESLSRGADILVGFDDGHGPALFAFGRFESVDGIPAPGFARWDGVDWSPVETGIAAPRNAVARADPPTDDPFPFYTATVFDDGSGPALYLSGRITFDDGSVHSVVRWRGGATVESVRTKASYDYPQAMAVFDDGRGAALFVSGLADGDGPSTHLHRFDGTMWSTVPGELDSRSVRTMHSFESGGSARLVVGGSFDGIHNVAGVGDVSGTRAIAAWDGQHWSSIAGGIPSGSVRTLATFDAGSGSQLFVGGPFAFTSEANEPVVGIAVPGESGWTAPPSIASAPLGVGALTPFRVGADPALFVGIPGTISAGPDVHRFHGIAAWDGAQLLAPGDPNAHGIEGSVRAALTLARPDGPRLFVSNVGLWDGTRWSAGPIGWSITDAISGMSVDRPGQHPLVYLLGSFREYSGGPLYSVAVWDGQSVMGLVPALGNIFYLGNNSIDLITAFDDGVQSSICFGGVIDVDGVHFGVGCLDDDGAHVLSAEGTPAQERGSDRMVGGVTALNDPVHPVLLAFGGFTSMDGQAIPAIAAWDGSAWSAPFPKLDDRMSAVLLASAVEDGHDVVYFNVEHEGNPDPELMRWDGASLTAIPIPDPMRSVVALAVDTTRSPARLFACTTTPPQSFGVPYEFDLWIREDGRWHRVDLPGGLAATHLVMFDNQLYALGTFWRVDGVASNHIASHPLDQPFPTLPAPCAGDCDWDGDVDLADFGILSAGLGAIVPTSRASGDLNGDLRVDIYDFGIFASNFACSGD